MNAHPSPTPSARLTVSDAQTGEVRSYTSDEWILAIRGQPVSPASGLPAAVPAEAAEPTGAVAVP